MFSHLRYISAALFRHPTLKTFLKGTRNIRPPLRHSTPLRLVLQRLTCSPFEPMATTSEWLLSLKTIFLVAITSARRAGELTALRADLPYIQFHPHKVILYPDISFLPKVVTDFHMNQPIVLPALSPSPSNDTEWSLYSLDVRRALAFYISHTSSFRKSHALFVSCCGNKRGNAVSSQTISKWIVHAIHLTYELARTPLPVPVKAHSTRALSTSMAFMRGVAIPDICRAATWLAPSTFVNHYRLDVHAKGDSLFGWAVLSSVL